MSFDKESLFLRLLHSSNVLKGVGDDGVSLKSKSNIKSNIKSSTKSSGVDFAKNSFANQTRFASIVDFASEFIISNDGFCEGIHFKREWLSLEQIATKAMLVNISDIIAMNARPKYALCSVVLPNLSPNEVAKITTALSNVAKDFGIVFIGGDTMSGDRLDFHITLFGILQGKILTRKGLKKGDLIFCTGRVGECLKSLRFLQKQTTLKSQNDSKKRLGQGRGQIKISAKSKRFSRFVSPTLRANFVKSIANFAHCGLDISDGVYAELNRLSALNHLGFCLANTTKSAKNIKKSDKLATTKPIKSCIILPKILQKNAYQSGEEYEMLFAISPKDKLALARKAKQTRTPLCFIGISKTQKTHFRAKIWH
ncbi:thiamine-phosphate kinase [Helicobacter sp. T3_23-1056]